MILQRDRSWERRVRGRFYKAHLQSQAAIQLATIEPLSVSTATLNVGRFAGAVAGRLRNNGSCTIDAIGPEALYAAVKSSLLVSFLLCLCKALGDHVCANMSDMNQFDCSG